MLALPERFYSQRYASDIASFMAANASIAEFIDSRLIPMATSIALLIALSAAHDAYWPLAGLWRSQRQESQCRCCSSET